MAIHTLTEPTPDLSDPPPLRYGAVDATRHVEAKRRRKEGSYANSTAQPSSPLGRGVGEGWNGFAKECHGLA